MSAARPAGGVQDDGVHLAGQEGSLRRHGDAALPVVPAVGDDGHGQRGTGRDLDFLPGQGHPGRQYPVFTQGNLLQREGEGGSPGAGIIDTEHRLIGQDGHAFRRGNPLRQGEDELEDAALLEGALVRGRPGVAEFEGFESIDPGQEGAVFQVGHRAVAGLDLTGPGGGLQLRDGAEGAGIQDGEGTAGHRLSGKRGLMVGKAVLDVEHGRIHAHDGDLVTRFPLPGETAFRGARGHFRRRAVRNGSRDGHETGIRHGNRFFGLATGEQERKKGRCPY